MNCVVFTISLHALRTEHVDSWTSNKSLVSQLLCGNRSSLAEAGPAAALGRFVDNRFRLTNYRFFFLLFIQFPPFCCIYSQILANLGHSWPLLTRKASKDEDFHIQVPFSYSQVKVWHRPEEFYITIVRLIQATGESYVCERKQWCNTERKTLMLRWEKNKQKT